MESTGEEISQSIDVPAAHEAKNSGQVAVVDEVVADEKPSDPEPEPVGAEPEQKLQLLTDIDLKDREAKDAPLDNTVDQVVPDIEKGQPSAPNGKLKIPGECNKTKKRVSISLHTESSDDLQNNRDDGDSKKDVGNLRHIIALLALSSIVLANANRQAFNQALVSMTKDRHQSAPVTTPLPDGGSFDTTTIRPVVEYTTTTTGEIETTDQSTPTTNEDDDKFDWSPKQIALLQSAFSYGYTPFMIPGGRLSEVYGAKWVVFASGFGSALCCMFAPFFADWDYHLLVMSRILMGLSQTGVSPALYALLARWLPSEESSIYLPMIKVAVQLGFMAGSLISGFFTWRMTFYQVGLIGILWSIIWAIFVSSEPRGHRLLSENELNYIESAIGRQTKSVEPKTTEGSETKKSGKKSAPWLAILTNPVVISLMLAKFTVKLSTDAQSMQIPMYLSKVFHVSKELNGTLSALNFAIQGIFTGFVAWLAKEFVVRKWFGLSKTGVRRLFQGTCNFGMAFAFILITFNMGNLNLVCCAIIMLSILAMFGAGGEPLTPIDLSIEYSASIMAIANSTANLSGIVLPPIVSFILAGDLSSAARWDVVHMIVATTIASGGLVYCLVNRAELIDFDSKVKSSKKSSSTDEQFTAIELATQENSKNNDLDRAI